MVDELLARASGTDAGANTRELIIGARTYGLPSIKAFEWIEKDAADVNKTAPARVVKVSIKASFVLEHLPLIKIQKLIISTFISLNNAVANFFFYNTAYTYCTDISWLLLFEMYYKR